MKIEIDPTVDFACKMLLGHPEHPRLTIHFLNAILRPAVPIVSVTILNPISLKKFESDKLSILDILAIDAENRRFCIEVQRTRPIQLPERLTYYTAGRLVDQIEEGEDYRSLRPSVGICLLNAVLFRREAAFHHQFRLRTELGLQLTDCLEIHLLELPKFSVRNDNGSILDARDQWMYFFRSAKGATVEHLRERLPDPVFNEAIGVLQMISRDPEERRRYFSRLKWEVDENTRLAVTREEAIHEGLALGIAQGLEQGMQQGRLEEKKLVIRSLGELLGETQEIGELQSASLEELDQIIGELQKRLRSRLS